MSLGTHKGLSTAQPAIYFEDDPNTGVGSSAADTLNFYAGGTSVMQLATPGTVNSVYFYQNTKTSIPDNTATAVFTVTVPNVDTAAMIEIDLLASIGGGSDNWESSRIAKGSIVVARTTGANAVAEVATLTLAQIGTVSGGETITLAYDLGSVSGAVGATNTFTIRVTIAHGGGTSSTHQCVALAKVVNANASGITLAAA